MEAETEFGQDHNSQNSSGVHPFIGDLSGLMIQVESYMNNILHQLLSNCFMAETNTTRGIQTIKINA